MNSGLFISWSRENGRTTDLARALGFETHFIYLPSKLGLLGRYARQLKATRELLAARRPERVALMLPPAPALLTFAGSRNKRVAHIMCDLHTGFFSDPKWAWAAQVSLRFMRRIGAVAVVTNSHLQGVCEAQHVDTIVLHDVITERINAAITGMHLLCPLSYANDEPVDEILEAARLTPEIEWKLTGRAPAAVQAVAPENITFTGFVDNDEYAELLQTSLGVIALTTRPHTMQRAGYESFGVGVPHVTSAFPELRQFYGQSAEYAQPNAASITGAVRRLVEHRDALVNRVQSVRSERTLEQQHALAELRAALALPSIQVSTSSEAHS